MGIPRVSQAGCPPHTTAIGEGKISTSCVQCGVKQKSVFSKRGPWDSAHAWSRDGPCYSVGPVNTQPQVPPEPTQGPPGFAGAPT